MKALIKDRAEPGIWMKEVAEPVMGHNDVMIKIKKTSLCGTDVHIYNWDDWAKSTVKVPLTVGHEFVGEIVEMGSEVKGFKVGDRVSGENHISCGFCRNCRAGRRHLCRLNISAGVTCNGCFAEYFVLPAENAYLIPDSISDNLATILNPLGNSTDTALAFNLVGEDVLITGAGPVGLMAVAVARHVGARYIVITDVNQYRLELAKKMGASLAIDTQQMSLKEAMNKLGMREGYDVGLEMSGNANAFNDMLNHMNNAGKVALLGFLPRETEINWNNVILKGLHIKGIYGREMFDTWYKMITMLQSGLNIAPVITHEFHISEYEKVFETMVEGNCGKIIMDWG